PSQVRAAVLLGDKEITIDQVQNLIDKAVREQPAAQQLARQHKLDQLGREIVRELVVHELVARAAQREHLTVDQQLLVQGRQELAQPVSASETDPSNLASNIVARVRGDDYLNDALLELELGTKYFEKVAVTVDYITISNDDASGTRREK